MLCAFLALLLGSTTATPHPADRPLADLTLEIADHGVHATVLVNFQFVDLVLETRGDPRVPPTAAEVERARTALRALFEGGNALAADGARVLPRFRDDFAVAEPLQVLRDAAPEYVRALTQIRFGIDYLLPRMPDQLTVTWDLYPEHPLTEARDSPVVRMRMRAVVVRDGGTEVLDFDTAHRTRAVALRQEVARDSAAVESSTASPAQRHIAVPVLLAVLGLVLLVRNRRLAVAAPCLLLVLVPGCGRAPAVHTAETDSWQVAVIPDRDPVPVNEHFTAEVVVRPRAGGTGSPIVTVDADMPSHGHGMNTKPRTTARGDGHFFVEGLLMHMPGAWELYVDVGEGRALQRAVFPMVLR